MLSGVCAWVDDGPGTARLYQTLTAQCTAVFQGHEGEISKVVFNPPGNRVLTASSDRSARVWDVHTGECVQILDGHTDEIFSCAFNYNGETIITGASMRLIPCRCSGCDGDACGWCFSARFSISHQRAQYASPFLCVFLLCRLQRQSLSDMAGQDGHARGSGSNSRRRRSGSRGNCSSGIRTPGPTILCPSAHGHHTARCVEASNRARPKRERL